MTMAQTRHVRSCVQQVSALENFMDYRLSVICYAPTNYGRGDYITCSKVGALEFEVVYLRMFSI